MVGFEELASAVGSRGVRSVEARRGQRRRCSREHAAAFVVASAAVSAACARNLPAARDLEVAT